MFDGKMKAITFSYDDAVTQDVRLIDIFNKYGMKGTFNINSELLGKTGELLRNGVKISHNKNKKEDVRSIYEGHEIAVHTLTHPLLQGIEDDDEIVRQVEEDRLRLSELAGYEVIGMAYPNCAPDQRVADIVKDRTNVKYARVVETTGGFDVPENLFWLEGTLYHHDEWDRLFETGRRFLELETDKPQIFYIWGHAYEFDIFPERWEQFEEFCRMMSGKDDIFYGTNREVLLGK